MTISAKLLHTVTNRLQLIMSLIDLGETETDETKRKRLFERARGAIRGLTELLEQHRRGKP